MIEVVHIFFQFQFQLGYQSQFLFMFSSKHGTVLLSFQDTDGVGFSPQGCFESTTSDRRVQLPTQGILQL